MADSSIVHLTRSEINKLDRIKRLNIINASTGIKPANLLGTISPAGTANLAIFSSVIHLGSNPPLLGFISRPPGEVERHTYENIKHNQVYTINHVNANLTQEAHFTSAKFPRETSEFAACNFTEEYVTGFEAPFVKESPIKIGLRFKQDIPIELNGTVMIIGEIEHLVMPSHILGDEGHLDLSAAVGISGLNTYYSLSKLGSYPYARVEDAERLS